MIRNAISEKFQFNITKVFSLSIVLKSAFEGKNSFPCDFLLAHPLPGRDFQ